MKKLLLALFIVLMASPVMAQSSVTTNLSDTMVVDIYKDKDIIIQEQMFVDKDIYIDVKVDLVTEKAAEAKAVVKAGNSWAFACDNCDEKTATILVSILENTGIVNVNQNSGHINNQGNVVAIAFDSTDGNGGTPPKGGYAEAQADVEQANVASIAFTQNTPWLDAIIYSSIKGNVGIVNVNQNVGNINNQHNVVAIAVAADAMVAISDAELGQVNTYVVAIDQTVKRNTLIYDSVNSNRGIVQVNQNAGALNNQANIVTIATQR